MKKKFDLSKLTLYPAVIFVFIITQLPFAITIIFSLLRWNVMRPDQGISFAGISNYITILTSKDTYQVLLNTLIIVVACLALCTVLAVLLGVLFNRKFPGGYIFRTLFVMPYFVMDCIVGIFWKTVLLNPNMGLNYYICKLFGMQAVDFFGKYALLTIIILIVWQWTPFFFLIVMGGLQGIPEEVQESAKLDGASPLQRLLWIDIPMIKKHIVTAMVLGLINILKVFGLVYVSTQGGPGVSSANLPYLTYRTIFNEWNVGKAAALAVITVVITLIVSQNFFKAVNKIQD